MTEFLVALPCALLLWFGVEYFRNGWARKLSAISASYDHAWSKSLSTDGSCLQSESGWAGNAPDVDPFQATTLDAPLQEAIDEYHPAVHLDDYSHVDDTVVRVTRPARWNNDTVATVQGRTRLICDEVPPAADADVLRPMSDRLGHAYIR